jgi:hypothetical protein
LETEHNLKRCRFTKKENGMKKLMAMAFAIALMVSVTAPAQEAAKQDEMKAENPKAEKMSKAAVSIVGKVGDDGKTFVSDKDSKTWKVSNPDALKGHEGHHVRVRAHVDADKDEIHVTSVKMLKNEMKEKM